MKKTLGSYLIAAVMAVSALIPLQVNVFAAEREGVYFYENDNFSGRVSNFNQEINIPYIGDYYVGNDAITSIKIVGTYEVTVYEHANFQGVWHKYRFSDSNVSNENIGNDRISSAKIKRISNAELEGVYVFQHDNFSGDWVKLTSSAADFRKLSIGNDSASSVKVVGNYSYSLYRDINYSGTPTTASYDIPSLSSTWVGNDNVSSITIRTRR